MTKLQQSTGSWSLSPGWDLNSSKSLPSTLWFHCNGHDLFSLLESAKSICLWDSRCSCYVRLLGSQIFCKQTKFLYTCMQIISILGFLLLSLVSSFQWIHCSNWTELFFFWVSLLRLNMLSCLQISQEKHLAMCLVQIHQGNNISLE